MKLEAKSQNRSLFISKNEEELILVPDWCKANDWKFVAHSFLTFEKIDFHITTSFDVVFFASPRAAQFFLDSSNDVGTFEIAVAGESTKRYIEKRGLTVHFCPVNGGDVTESSELFANWVGQRSVLFPTSNISQKSYTRFLTSDQFEITTVYKTQISTDIVDNFDVYAFTSPSNVKGFLANNNFPEGAVIIAWGETTANTIKQHAPTLHIHVMQHSSEQELLQLLK